MISPLEYVFGVCDISRRYIRRSADDKDLIDRILQISQQVRTDVLHAEVDAHLRAHYLIVSVAIGFVRSPSVELMNGDRTDPIRSMIEKLHQKV